MTPFARQFDSAQYDPQWRERIAQEESYDDGDDDYITHMKFECRQERFV
jgi:hypothetical protein